MEKSNHSLSGLDRLFVWHPFTQAKTAPPPIPIVKGEGVYLYDERGNAYIDGISSWWTNLHGHAHPFITSKIKEQAERLEHVLFAGFTHAPAVHLAEKLIACLPGKMSKIFYTDNGSTAVEAALKMALQFWKNRGEERTQVICFKHSYHGDTFGAMSAAGRNEFNRPFWSHLFKTVAIDPPFLGKEEASIDQLKKILTRERLACFIFEPLVLAAGGMRIYPETGLNELLKICKEAGVLTIADEVMTGFGRTGPLFACKHLNEAPDFYCLSKGLTGGFLPLGAVACREEIFEAFLSDQTELAFLHGHSYTANPLACASALASLDLLLAPACTEGRRCIESLHKEFCLHWQGHPALTRCECKGTLLAIDYKAESQTYFQPMKERLHDFFLKQGILLRPLGNVLYVLPPYCINEAELQLIYAQISQTFEV
ncbi:MAG: adenosylmethionine--8-amino-7-oxononanoate transaminase [Parachlamydia sp.]|jgi:adenosylmethionine-8-amino-7-oxononanoate aminotransferase|nr:adenosylmethionine--8-amino-7-oxononanoate transaminase [Parachlamydia sp.]